ncbi:MAG: membrane protein insertase YidC [Steroidobacteraceae bacterium]
MWMQGLNALYTLFSIQFGLPEAVSVVALTLVLRLICLPLSLTAAYQAQQNKQRMDLLKPKLDALRARLKDDPQQLAAQTMALYREQGISFLGKWGLLNMLAQSSVGIGIYRTVMSLSLSSRFLWISNLAKPDVLLTVIVTILMVVAMMLMPGATQNSMSAWIILIPVGISLIFLISMPASVGLYWATTNVVTLLQSIALKTMVRNRGRRARG